MDERVIRVTRPGGGNKGSNAVFTTKYTKWSFFPKFLAWQFGQASNLFFLAISAMQQIPGVSPTSKLSTIVPLMIIIALSGLKELFEDQKRREDDERANNSVTRRLVGFGDGTGGTICFWQDLDVGQIVKVEKDESIPADLLFLHGSTADGQAFIETANIDGETNLKTKEALFPLKDVDEGDLVVRVEAPTDQIYKFNGTVRVKDQVRQVKIENLLLRGSCLRNTEWVVGLVVYTGHETRIQQNTAASTPLKLVQFDGMVNRQIYWMLLVLLGMVVSTFVFWSFTSSEAKFDPWSLLLRLCTYLVLYHSIVPISLLMTMEFVRYQLSRLICSDLEMYDEALGPIRINNSSVVDELGQVKYLLTDKTGTLTQNRMELVSFVDANGQKYRNAVSSAGHEMLRAMLLCHSVTVGSHGELHGSSPDEVAILQGCLQRFNSTVVKRTSTSITIKIEGHEETYEIVRVIGYTSERRRMSIVVRGGDNVLRMVMKGADEVVMGRLAKNQSPSVHEILYNVISDFAHSGLRTLCYAHRILSPIDFHDLQDEDLMESEVHLVGATAVEDRLAEGVPETLQALRQAGIKVWMVTGDRRDTAVSVGVACGLIDKPENALVVDGRALDGMLEDPLFIPKATKAPAVIFCRTSPAQKRQLAEALKSLDCVCLAVGDGANDVGMIQAASIGIGLLGLEGRQAARSADIALPAFSHLRRLLLVHGAWSYHRMAKTIIFCVYKNFLLISAQFWYGWVSGGSGQTLFETWMLSLFNVLFTIGVPVVIGLTDQHVKASLLLRHPDLYKLGQRNEGMAVGRFWRAALNGALQSLFILLLVALLFGEGVGSDGLVGGLWFFGCTVYLCILLTLLLKACLLLAAWNALTALTLLFSLTSWLAYLALLAAPLQLSEGALTGIPARALQTPAFGLTVLLVPVVVLGRDGVWKFVRRAYMPREYHIIQELQNHHSV